ncbi:aminopeptidase P family protein [Candidatus Woesearchaeota archaeon]|nr:aminopeptidase P family protein [Candidatus Woesearchaeota archaeon]
MVKSTEKDNTKTRIARLREKMKENGIDIILLSSLSNSEPNLSYLLCGDITPSFLIVPKKGNSTVLVSKMDYERAKTALKDVSVCVFEKPLNAQISRIIKKRKAAKLGINRDIISVNEFLAIRKKLMKHRFVDISRMLLELRSIKSKNEIALIRKACRISDQILALMFKKIKSLRTEEDVRQFLIDKTRKRRCTTSFEPLVASGANSGLVHYMGKNVILKPGFCFIDFGVDYKGYKSDTTRVVYRGKPKQGELAIYNMLFDIQKMAVDMVRPGVKCSEIDIAVRERLGPYNEYFNHSLGHGVGVQIHELPNLSSNSKDILKAGMVLTIEPGIYFSKRFKKRYGMRIEDTVLVTEKGHEVLTRARKDLLIV